MKIKFIRLICWFNFQFKQSNVILRKGLAVKMKFSGHKNRKKEEKWCFNLLNEGWKHDVRLLHTQINLQPRGIDLQIAAVQTSGDSSCYSVHLSSTSAGAHLLYGFDCCQLPINTYGMLIRTAESTTSGDFSDPFTTSAFIFTRASCAICICILHGESGEEAGVGLKARESYWSCNMWINGPRAFGDHVSFKLFGAN